MKFKQILTLLFLMGETGATYATLQDEDLPLGNVEGSRDRDRKGRWKYFYVNYHKVRLFDGKQESFQYVRADDCVIEESVGNFEQKFTLNSVPFEIFSKDERKEGHQRNPNGIPYHNPKTGKSFISKTFIDRLDQMPDKPETEVKQPKNRVGAIAGGISGGLIGNLIFDQFLQKRSTYFAQWLTRKIGYTEKNTKSFDRYAKALSWTTRFAFDGVFAVIGYFVTSKIENMVK